MKKEIDWFGLTCLACIVSFGFSLDQLSEMNKKDIEVTVIPIKIEKSEQKAE